MSSNIGGGLWNIVTTGTQIRHSRDMYRNYAIFNKVVWKEVCSTLFIFEPGWTCWSLFIDWYERFRIPLTVYLQCKTFMFLNSMTKKVWSSMPGKKILSGCTFCSILWNSPWHCHSCSHRWKQILSIIKNMEGLCHKVMVVIWYFVPENVWCWNQTTGTKY